MGPIQITLLILGVSLVVAVAAFLAGTIYRKKVAEREIGSAEEEATRIINEAIRGGESCPGADRSCLCGRERQDPGAGDHRPPAGADLPAEGG